MSNVYDNQAFFDEYAKMHRSQHGLEGAGEWHQLQPLFPDLTGKRVLDLGCGYGWHCKYAIERGAKAVLGLDLSEKMIAAAQDKNCDDRITYKVCGLDEFDYPQDSYDFVVSNLVLHYIEKLDEVYANVYKTLTNGGVFLFNIEHPIFTSGVNQDWIYDSENKPKYWAIDDYFYCNERKTHFLGQDVTKQHHTLTQIINGLLKVGFTIDTVEEAMPPQDMMHLNGMKDEMRRPMMLLIKVKK